MSRLSLLGLVIAIYGLIVLIGAAVACPAKHASISTSIFMMLTGVAFYLLGKEHEELKVKK
jgi:predicted tellurium resistance membrane protein TerC